eukprot:31223-Pelagococcus_subviridis.AAC.3
MAFSPVQGRKETTFNRVVDERTSDLTDVSRLTPCRETSSDRPRTWLARTRWIQKLTLLASAPPLRFPAANSLP